MTDDNLSDTDVPQGFSVISWYRSIPLCDDVWLGMQAQHIAAVELGIIRPLELHTARKLFNEEGAADLLLALNGVSQMWLFSLYEFLRTWRQRATQLLQLAEQYGRTKSTKQKAFLTKTLADAKGKEKHIYSGLSFYSHHISKIADANFVASIKDYYEKTDGYFSFIEELRMNLAKHEIPKKRGMVAEMPGYARIDIVKGTLYWQFIGTDGGLQKLDRREAANFFLGIEVPAMMTTTLFGTNCSNRPHAPILRTASLVWKAVEPFRPWLARSLKYRLEQS
jgi:hypothetical protein